MVVNQNAQTDLQRAENERSQVHANLLTMQKQVADAQTRVIQVQGENSQIKAQFKNAIAQREVALASENRYKESNNALRNELENKNSLIESVHRIENSMSAQNMVEKEKLDEEVASYMVAGFGGLLTQLTNNQADYINVPVEGPFKPEAYKY